METVYEIVKAWGITPYEIQEIKGNVWKVFTGEGNYALKRSLISEKKLHFIAQGQEALSQYGFSGFSHPILSQDAPYVKAYGSNFTLYEWVEGERCDFDNIDHLSAAAAALAEFHLYSRSCNLKEQFPKRMMYSSWIERTKKRIAEMETYREKAAKGDRFFFEKMYLGFYQPFLSKAMESERLLLTSAYPKIAKEEKEVGAFIHYDVAARNFVIQRNKAYLIDFDYCILDITLVDLMRLIKRSLKYGENAKTKIDTIVSSYTAVKPLSEDHWQVLYALLLFPQKYWRLAQRYFNGEHDWDEETFAKKMSNTVEELEREDIWLPMLKERVGLK